MTSPNPTTFDELLEYPKLAKDMTLDELQRHCSPYFPHTRPINKIESAMEVIERKVTASLDDDAIERMAEEIRLRRPDLI